MQDVSKLVSNKIAKENKIGFFLYLCFIPSFFIFDFYLEDKASG